MILEFLHQQIWRPVSELDFLSLDQVEASQSAGSLSWECESQPADPFRFNQGDLIGLRGRDSDSDPWVNLFFGAISEDPERHYEGNFSLDKYIAHDLWNTLERCTYQLTTFVPEGFNKSHVILFRDASGNRMTTGQQIKDILDFARATGVSISYDPADLANMYVQPPSDEQTDLSCAEAIQKGLRWQPDVFTLFEHSESGSTLRFFQADQETPIRLALSDVLKTGGFSIRKKSDLALRGVVINYEIENRIIDGTTQTIQTDTAGHIEGPNVLVHTVQVDGSYQIQTEASITITVSDIPTNYKSNLDFVRLFFPYVCWFPSATTGNNLPVSVPYNFYITSGYQDGYGVVSYPMTFQWWVAIKRSKLFGEIIACDSDGFPHGSYYSYEWRSIILNLTSSPAGTYTRVGDPITIPGEEVPSGVAGALFNARRWPLYDGILTREITDLKTIASPRNNLNILGGLAEYTDMRAPVQQITRRWFDQTETLKFGHPEQAGITDYIDFLRSNRSVNRPSRRTWRT
jgi:hypothetical protein